MQKSRMIETRVLVALGMTRIVYILILIVVIQVCVCVCVCVCVDIYIYTYVYVYMYVYVCVCVFLSKLIELCTLKSVYFIMCKLYLNFYYF